MSRKKLINILENVFQPSVNQMMKSELMGASVKETALAAETALTLDFTSNRFHDLALGTANITLNATVAGLKPGELVFLKVTQNSVAARTITWGTGIVTDATVTAAVDDIDLFMGVFDGTNIILGALAQNVS